MLTVHLLGPVEVRRDGEALELGGPQQRAVIAHLALDVGRVVSADRLIDRLWGDQPPRTPLGTLQSYVSRLRRSIEPDRSAGAAPSVLVSEAPGYALRLPEDVVDVHAFRSQLVDARRAAAEGRGGDALAAFDAALQLWRGPALGGIGSSDDVAAIVQRLDEERMAATEDRIDVLLALGRHGVAVAELHALAGEHPLRERLWSQLALALYRSGRQAEALRAVTTARTTLIDELGIDPGPELRELERRILAQDPTLALPDAEAETIAPVVVAPVRPAASSAAEPQLVGRSTERAAIVEALEGAESGRPAVVLVEGDPGIGKSTLVASVQADAEAQGWSVATGRCVEAGLAPSLWPCLEIARSLAEVDPDGPLAALTSAGAANPLTPVEVAERFIDTIDSIGGRWLFVIEDAHWADRASLDLVKLVIDRLGRRPVAVLVTHRPSELVPESRLADAVATWDRSGLRHVTMSPLGVDDVGRLMEITNGVAPDTDVAERVHARTAGSPLFVVELARLAGEGGALDTTGVPGAIRDVVRGRLAGLPDATLAELELVAVAGERFDLATVQRASARDAEMFLDALEPAVVTRVLVPEGRGFRFAHAIVRDAVLATVAPLRRSRLHDAVADALTAIHGDAHDAAEPIAHHRLAAIPIGDVVRASSAASRASDVARWRGAVEEAEVWAERAVEVLAGAPRSHEVDLAEAVALETLAAAAYRSAEAPWRGRVAARVAALSHRSDNDALVALSLFLNWGEIDEAADLSEIEPSTERARALAARTASPYASVLANYMVGSADLLLGRLRSAVDALERSIAATGALDPDEPPEHVPLPMVPLVAAIAAAAHGDAEAARVHAGRRTRSWMAERAAVDPSADVAIAFGGAVVEALLGSPDGAIALLDGVDLVDAGQFILFERTVAEVVHGWAIAQHGDGAGLAAAFAALDRLDASIDRVLVSCLRTLVADACLQLGDDRAPALLERAVEEATSRGEVFWLSETRRVQAEADARFGDGSRVDELLAIAEQLAAEHEALDIARRIEETRARLAHRGTHEAAG